MTAAPLRCVVDASVGIKLFVAEAHSEKAYALFAQLAAEPPAQLYVPDLFYVECANILWKYVRRFGRSADDARKDLKALGALTLQTVSAASLLPAVLDIALARAVTCYDACYVALAQRLRAPLVTADRKLAGLLAPAGYAVRWLGDLSAVEPGATLNL